MAGQPPIAAVDPRGEGKEESPQEEAALVAGALTGGRRTTGSTRWSEEGQWRRPSLSGRKGLCGCDRKGLYRAVASELSRLDLFARRSRPRLGPGGPWGGLRGYTTALGNKTGS